MCEPTVEYATTRDGIDEIHIECRMSDGQKGVFIYVEHGFEQLARRIVKFLNAKTKK